MDDDIAAALGGPPQPSTLSNQGASLEATLTQAIEQLKSEGGAPQNKEAEVRRKLQGLSQRRGELGVGNLSERAGQAINFAFPVSSAMAQNLVQPTSKDDLSAMSADQQVDAQITALQNAIKAKEAARATATRGLPSAQIRAINAQYEPELKALNTRLDGLMSQKLNRLASKSQSEKGWQETATEDEKWWRRKGVPLAGGAFSALTSTAAEFAPAKYRGAARTGAAAVNMTGSVLEGVAAAFWPIYNDLGLPEDSDGYKKAVANLGKFSFYLTQVAPELMASVVAGGIGTVGGMKAGQSTRYLGSAIGNAILKSYRALQGKKASTRRPRNLLQNNAAKAAGPKVYAPDETPLAQSMGDDWRSYLQ